MFDSDITYLSYQIGLANGKINSSMNAIQYVKKFIVTSKLKQFVVFTIHNHIMTCIIDQLIVISLLKNMKMDNIANIILSYLFEL